MIFRFFALGNQCKQLFSIIISTVYTRVLCAFWKPNFKVVASYTKYKNSLYTASSGYAVDQTIYPFNVDKLALNLI